ncbi:MAG: LysE family translocator [Bacteroidales bacterium]|nr:LysE family translocator [Bacteroidales bacterium]
MIGIKDFGLFIALSWILIITPGPDFIYVLTRGISNGKKAGLISAFGVTLGIFVHTIFAALGLSIILKTSAIAFMIVKFFGAGYLIYYGIKTIMDNKELKINNTGIIKSNKIFTQGFLSNVFNPKVALFFIAFLPQFVNSGKHESTAIQFLILGVVFAVFTIIFLSALGYFSGWIGQYLTGKNNLFSKRLKSMSGFILIFLGIRLALIRQK